MPIYVYSCEACGMKFERLVGVTRDEEELKCPGCSGRKVRKELTTFSVGKPSCSNENPSCPPGCHGGGCSLG
jgi:putative FmdB family regulatory protein